MIGISGLPWDLFYPLRYQGVLFESGVGDLYGVNFADTKEVGTIIPNLIVKYMSLFIV